MERKIMARWSRSIAILLAVGTLLLGAWTDAAVAEKKDKLEFDMVVSADAKMCLPRATGHVTIESAEDNQRMRVEVEGLAPRTTYTLFVLQVPTGPFAMSWYQGDITTNHEGRGHKTFLGIFSSETFAFAPTANIAAPQTHPGIDAATNPFTAPIHMYHLGLWFSDPDDAGAAGCTDARKPFDGDHVAGIQVLNTSNAGTEAANGPLGKFRP